MWGKKVAELCQVDAISQAFLQFGGGGKLLVQTGLHPAVCTHPHKHKNRLRVKIGTDANNTSHCVKIII